MTACPVTVLGGYLGSGKTTLVNHLLRQADGRRLAVLVNDFGDLPIDADLIVAQEGDVISLSGGCVCCSYGNDLTMALLDLQSLETPPEHIIIEASGVALPGAIAQSLTLLQGFSLDGVVVLVDAATIREHADDRYLGDTVQRQLQHADLILLNKLDLVTHEQRVATLEWLGGEVSHTRVIEATRSAVPIDVVLAPGRVVDSDVLDATPHDTSLFRSLEFPIMHRCDVAALARRLADQEAGLVRAKGFVRDLDDVVKTIQVVGRRWATELAPADVRLGVVCIGLRTELSEAGLRVLIEQAEDVIG